MLPAPGAQLLPGPRVLSRALAARTLQMGMGLVLPGAGAAGRAAGCSVTFLGRAARAAVALLFHTRSQCSGSSAGRFVQLIAAESARASSAQTQQCLQMHFALYRTFWEVAEPRQVGSLGIGWRYQTLPRGAGREQW